MDDAIIAAMEAELETVEAKASGLRSLIALYKRPGTATKPRGASAVGPLAPTPPRHYGGGSGASKQTAVEAVRQTARLMAEAADPDPVPTKDILAKLDADGVEVGGAIPANVVSSILSRAKDEFRSNGRMGWTLVRHNENGPPEGGPDAGGVAAPSSDNRTELDALFD